MKFATIYDTCEKHQILVSIVKGEDNWGLSFSTWVEDCGKVETIYGFDNIKEAVEAFNQTTRAVAIHVIKDVIAELKNVTEETTH